MVDSYDPRWGDDLRDRDGDSREFGRAGTDPREREQVDPRDVFRDHVDLPRGLDREHVHTRDHDYTLRGLKRAPWPPWRLPRGARERLPGQVR